MSRAAKLAGPTAKASPASAAVALLQRKCACGGKAGVDGECVECASTKLQRKPRGPSASTPAPDLLGRQSKPTETEAPNAAPAGQQAAPPAPAVQQLAPCSGSAVNAWIPDPDNARKQLFGLTTTKLASATIPEFKVGPAPGGKGVVVLPTTVAPPQTDMQYLAEGRYKDRGINFRPQDGSGFKTRPGGYANMWSIDKAGSARLAAGEQEHCDDIRLSYALTLQAFAAIVNDMAAKGTVFANEAAARRALATQVKIDPDSIGDYFVCVAKFMRSARDNRKWHTPARPHPSEVAYDSTERDEVAILPLGAGALPDVGKHPAWELLMDAAASPECLGLTTLAPAAKKPAGAQLSRKAASEVSEAAFAPEIVHRVLQTPGKPLSPKERNAMEPRFARRFDDVRIHDDAEAAASARAVDALAYTVGAHIVFDSGRYDAASASGRELLAHELAHVTQQARAGATHSGDPIAIAPSRTAEEADADRMAAVAVTGAAAMFAPSGNIAPARQAGAPVALQRQTAPAANPGPAPTAAVDGPGPYDGCPSAAPESGENLLEKVKSARETAGIAVGDALQRLDEPTSRRTTALLEQHFRLDPENPAHVGDIARIRKQFRGMLDAIHSPIRILCRSATGRGAGMPKDDECARSNANSPSCAAGNPGATVTLCEAALIQDTAPDISHLVKTLLHEFAHIACAGDPAIEPKGVERYYEAGRSPPGQARPDVTCADSYAWFAVDAHGGPLRQAPAGKATSEPDAAKSNAAKSRGDDESFGTKAYRFLTNIPIIGLLVKAIFGASLADRDLVDYLAALTRNDRIEDAIDSDDKARAIAMRWKAHDPAFDLTARQRVLLVQEMLSGAVGGDDQDRILDLLELSESEPLGKMFGPGGLRVRALEEKLEGERRERLEAFFATRFKGGRAALLSGVVEPLGEARGAAEMTAAFLGSGPVAAARAIRKAVEGPGTDEAAVYAALQPFARDTLRIQRAYQEFYDEDLRDRIESEMSGAELERALALLETPYERYLQEAASWLKRFPAVGFGLPWKSRDWYDDRLWTPQYDTSKKEWMLVLVNGKPHAAIDAMFYEQSRWHVDCAVFVEVVQLFALRQSLGATRFDESIGSRMVLRAHGSTGLAQKLLYKRAAPNASFAVSGAGQLPSVDNPEEVLASAPIGSRVRWTSQLLYDKANALPGEELWSIELQSWPFFQHENTIKLGPDAYGAQGVGGSSHVTRETIESALAKITADVIPDADAAKIRANIFVSEIEIYQQPDVGQQIEPGATSAEKGPRP